MGHRPSVTKLWMISLTEFFKDPLNFMSDILNNFKTLKKKISLIDNMGHEVLNCTETTSYLCISFKSLTGCHIVSCVTILTQKEQRKRLEKMYHFHFNGEVIFQTAPDCSTRQFDTDLFWEPEIQAFYRNDLSPDENIIILS